MNKKKSEKVECFLSLSGKEAVTKQARENLLKDMNNGEIDELISNSGSVQAKNFYHSFKSEG